MLISEAYKQQNQELHAHGDFGVMGSRYAHIIARICETEGTRDVLDYGCGQQALARSMPFPVRGYDPCIPGLDAGPQPADIVSCTDVLEHVEPDCIDAVLDHLGGLTKRVAFLVIPTRPAKKFLPDGRNAHLIQQPAEWWFPKLYARFHCVQINNMLIRPGKSAGFSAICRNPINEE